MIPFAAIVAGRQRLAWREFPVGTLVLGFVIAVVLRATHDSLFDHGGAWVIGTLVVGAAVATLQSWRRARRSR
jgi:uncharacterized membrane protein